MECTDVFYIPESAFTYDIKKCVKGVTNHNTNKMRDRAFCMLSAFWLMLNYDYFSFYSDDSGTWVSASVLNAIGSDFSKLFDKLCKLNKKRYEKNSTFHYVQVKRKLCLVSRHHYKINACAGKVGSSLKCIKITKENRLYSKIKKILENAKSSLSDSIKAEQENLRLSECKIVERYRNMYLDEKKAIAILERKYGITLEEALHYKDVTKNSIEKKDIPVFNRAIFFNRQYALVKKFNSGEYRASAKFGRIFTAFHNLISELRCCLRTRNGEKMIELYDMSGAHTVSWFTLCYDYEKNNGNAKLASQYLDYITEMGKDPYRFAVNGVFKDDRTSAKNASMSYFFAGKNDCDKRGGFIGRMKEMNNFNEMLCFCKEYMSIAKSWNSFLLDNAILTDVFKTVNFTPEIWYVLTGKKYKDICLYNGGFEYKSFDTILGRKDLSKGKADVNVLNIIVDVAYKSMFQYHIENCIKDKFGYDALKTSNNIKKYFNDKTNEIVDIIRAIREKNHIESKTTRRKDAKGNTPNASVVGQISEGFTLVDYIVPELVDKTGCNEIVTFHDAILVPESLVSKINVNELNMKVISLYIMNVEYVFSHIDDYFNGNIEAPFSYVA